MDSPSGLFVCPVQPSFTFKIMEDFDELTEFTAFNEEFDGPFFPHDEEPD